MYALGRAGAPTDTGTRTHRCPLAAAHEYTRWNLVLQVPHQGRAHQVPAESAGTGLPLQRATCLASSFWDLTLRSFDLKQLAAARHVDVAAVSGEEVGHVARCHVALLEEAPHQKKDLFWQRVELDRASCQKEDRWWRRIQRENRAMHLEKGTGADSRGTYRAAK